MSELEFLCADQAERRAGFDPIARSPLERALRNAPPEIEDISQRAKIEVRGEIDSLDEPHFFRITRRRALVFCDGAEGAAVRARLREKFDHVVDVTSALAGVRISGEPLLRRLTDLDLDALPAAGAVARVPAIVLRSGDEFSIFFAQEYGHYFARVVIDTTTGLTA